MSTVTGEVVINEAAERLGGLEGKKVLVIGVGNVGLSAALTAAKKEQQLLLLALHQHFEANYKNKALNLN